MMADSNTSLPQEQVPSADLCVLAESYLNPTVCGHSIPIKHWMLASATHRCPICHHPVTYIADGVAAAMLVSREDSKAQLFRNSEALVYFKYGKLTYHLSVPCSNPVQGVSFLQSWSGWWTNLYSWNLQGVVSPNTAQQRVASVLGISLPHLKVHIA
jgi:hypothetical protein